MIKKRIFFYSCFLFILTLTPQLSIADSASIFVDCGRDRGPVNRKVFGNNIIAYDPATYEDWAKEYYGYSDYGAGVWDPKWKQLCKEPVALARDAGVSVLRFPGGCGSHAYDWRSAIGDKRGHFLYGVDEFIATCTAINAEPIITLSYYIGDQSDAAELVQYLESFGVKYYEVGNEIPHGNHRNIGHVSADEYSHRYLLFYNSMKAIDPAVQVGIVFDSPQWNRDVLNIVYDKLDFAIVHIYPSPGVGAQALLTMDPRDIFKLSLAKIDTVYEFELKNTLRLLKDISGKDVPLAITEYNGGFFQDKPLAYRHSIGTSLINAELLRIFMKPENNILMANYWQFCNSYWGMIYNGFDDDTKALDQPYVKRPNYYVFEMYYKHFGDMLIGADVKCDLYEVRGNKIPYLSVNASKNSEGNKVYLMVVNKNMDSSEITSIDLKDFVPANEINAWVLNGPSVDATNEVKHDNVKVTHKTFKIIGNPFEFTFEPHSLTAIEIMRKK